MPHIEYEKLTDERLGEPSATVQARVTSARERQRARFNGTRLTANAEMTPTEIREFCGVDVVVQGLL